MCGPGDVTLGWDCTLCCPIHSKPPCAMCRFPYLSLRGKMHFLPPQETLCHVHTEKKKKLKIRYMTKSSVRSFQSKGQPMNKISLNFEQLNHGNEECVGKTSPLQCLF